jgi:hypothetical protein
MKKLSVLGILVLLTLTTGLALAQSRLSSVPGQAATPTATAAATLTLPAIPGTTEIALDPAIRTEIVKQLPTQLKDAAFKLFVSDDASDKVAGGADTALTGAGYKFGIPGQTKPVEQSGTYAGLYTKTGSPDLLFAITAVPTDTTQLNNLNIPGITAADAQKFLDQVKGHKTLVIVIGAPNLLQSLTQLATATSGATPAAATPAAATPVATTATAPRVTLGTNSSVTIRPSPGQGGASTTSQGQGGAPSTGLGGENGSDGGLPSSLILLSLLALLIASGAGYIAAKTRRP